MWAQQGQNVLSLVSKHKARIRFWYPSTRLSVYNVLSDAHWCECWFALLFLMLRLLNGEPSQALWNVAVILLFIIDIIDFL